MKQTLHKLLCLLLVLSMLLGAAPAVFAEGESDPITPPSTQVEHNDTHTLIYTRNNDGTHTVSCEEDGCNFIQTKEACTYGAAEWDGLAGHKETCTKCGYVKSENCKLKYVYVAPDAHQSVCEVCGHVYGSATKCTVTSWTPVGGGKHSGPCSVCGTVYQEDCEDADKDGKCDVCGGDVATAPETKTIISFERVSNITVPVGTAQNAVGLPSFVTGYTSDRKTVSCPVSWSCTNYNPNKAGTYTFTGTITVPEGYTLGTNVSATLTVSVTLQDYSIKLSADSSSVSVGGTKNITAAISSPAGTASNLTVAWSVSDTTGRIATISSGSSWWGINDRTGTLSAISAGSSTSGTNVTVTATLKSGSQVLATDSVTVRIVPATAAAIRQSVAGSGVTFGESAFYSALGSSLGKQLDYVVFDTLSSSRGTLYSSNSSRASKLTSSSKCFYKYSSYDNGYDLDEIYFEVANNYTGSSVTLGYTAYNSYGYVIAIGSVELSLSTAKISYTVSSDSKLTFDEDDFRSVLRASYSGSTLSYVQFDMSEAVFGSAYGGSSKYGYLYVDSSLKTKLTTSNDSYPFAYRYSTSSSRYYDLDDVTYVPGTATGKYTVSIPFTAYGTGYETVSGTVEIQVNESDAFTIDCIGTNFSAAAKVIADEFKTATYIMFDLPESGTLYYDFDAINDYGHKVRSTYAYYLDPGTKDEYDLDEVYFVPAAGDTRATIRFDVYSGKTKIDSGSVTFSIKSRTSSRVFTDVTYANTGSWSADSVDFMYANGLIYGTGKNKFNPNGTMTRGDLVLILYRLAGEPSVSSIKNPFTDIKSSDYYYKAVLWAYANNVVNGTGGSTFSPKAAVTREQLATILHRYSGSPSSSIRLGSFTDASSVSSYATNAMKWAVGKGIITGSGTKLDPRSSATRAQVAAMLHRYLTK